MALVVDDEFLIAVELEAILTGGGYLVLSAVNVAEARNLAALRPIDVAVLDFRMGAGAIDFARELQAHGIPMLFCTASTLEEVHVIFPTAVVIGKPFSGDELLAGVKATLCR